MQTVPTTASNGNTANDTTREQLLSLLGELTEKLEPAPAPKPEKITMAHIYMAPYQSEREDLGLATESVETCANALRREVQKIVRALPPMENERVWKHIFEHSLDEFEDMVKAMGWHACAMRRHADHLVHLVVMAAGGDPEAVAALQGGECHE